MDDAFIVNMKMQQAVLKLVNGDGAGAEPILLDVLARQPGHADALFMLGSARAMRGDHAGAIAQFDAAIRARPGHVQALAQKARSLDALDRQEEAVAAADAVSRVRAADAWSLDTAGVVFTRAHLYERAAALYERAAKAGKAPGYHYNHGSALTALGRFDEARAAFERCLQLDPNNGTALTAMVQITKQTPERNAIARLTGMAQRVAADPRAMYEVGHALAKAHEDLGDVRQAMAWLARAKAGLHRQYRAESDAALFAAAERSAGAVGAGGPPEGPIFVLGLPRSGTTLVERILSSHGGVTSVGELNDFANVLKTATGVRGERLVSGELVAAGEGTDLAAVGRAYLQRVKTVRGVTGRFVDKLPMNVFLAPLILRALPGARVICLKRNPADAALGNYRQAFEGDVADLGYTFDMADTARFVVRFEAMTRRFAEALPGERFMLQSYEGLVADIDGQVRRLLDFCGLPFEQACVDFHTNAAPVATASAAQVREPLNTAGIGRWRKYRPEFDPALRVLAEAGLMEALD